MNPPIRVLYAEDNPQDADLTRAYFAEHAPEFVFEIAATGKECLERLRTAGCDLLLLDYRLPDMDGLDVLITLVHAGLLVPVVMVTSVGDEDLVVKALRVGAADYVPKTSNYLESLPGILSAAVEKHRRNQGQGLATAELRRILYVEHAEADIELTLRHFAETAPHLAVDIARTCTEALARLGQPHTYELVLIDLRMPDMNGLDFIHEAKLMPGPLPPIVIVTGQGDDITAIAALNLGAADYIVKRAGYLDKLSPTIEHAIDRERLARVNTELRNELAERTLAEEAREESERKLRLHLQNTPVAVIEWDTAFRVTSWNLAAERIFGYPAAEAVGQHASFIVPEAIRPIIDAVFAELLGQSGGEHSTNENVTRDGRVVVCEWFNTPLTSADGTVIGVASLAEDITERKLAEAALHKSEDLYRSLFDNMLNGFAYCRMLFEDGRPRDFVFLSVNNAFEAQTGLKDAVGRKVSEVIPGLRETDPQIFELYGRVAGTGQPERIETFVRAMQMWFSISVYSPAPGYFVAVFDVVTERKQAEAALRESEERFRLLVDESPYAIAVHQDGGIVFVNRAALSLMGAASADELIGKPISTILHPDRWDAAQDRISRMLQGETGLYPVEDRFVRLDGSEVQVEVTAAPFTFRGRPAIQVIALDITAHKVAEAALRETEERFRATFEQAAVGISHVAPDGRWLRVNQRLCDIVGYTREELLQKSFMDITDPGDVEANAEAARRLRAGEIETHSTEKRYVRKDGSLVWVDLTSSLVRTAAGEPDYFISVTNDISARKRVEAMLELESAALGAAADTIVITDPTGEIERVNHAFSAVTGYSAEEAIGKNPRELLRSGEHGQPFYREMWDTILAGKVWQGELSNRRKDGSLYFEDKSITPVRDADGEITHFVAVGRDVTERKRLEAQFLQSQKMESVGQLAGGIAHDFNNLLNVITGTAFLVSEQLAADDPLREDLHAITEAANRAATMTRQLLAFSRKQIMQPKVIDLGELVLDLEGMLRRLIGEDVDLTVVAARGLGGIKADPGQIEQVVVNLAVNARDAMPGGGTLTIALEAVDLDEAHAAAVPPMQPGPHVILTVSDTGSGMDEETRARIFEPFFTTKEVGKGTGLGLSTVYGIVQQSGGAIRVDSELGKGTSFRIWFPRLDEEAQAEQAAPQVAPRRGAETILVVEDYLGLRILARRMLENAGYTVLLAGNGNEAQQVLKSHDGPVDLVLTDVVMPGMGGRDLAAWIKEARPETRVIYTSGYTNDALLRQGVDTDAAHFLAKPYTQDELTRTVRAVLGAD